MPFNEFTYFIFFVMFVLCAGLQFAYYRNIVSVSKLTNPNFGLVQRSYLIPFSLFIIADWLQAPYLYDLYAKYAFETHQIAAIYAAGLVASVIFGTFGQLLPDYVSRCFLIILSAVVCCVSALMKLSSDYGVLIGSRILQGSASSVLFMALSAWYGTAHVDADFPREWLPVTFTKSTYISNLFAVVAGVVGDFLSQFLGLGPVAPSIFGIIPLLIGIAFVMRAWPDNKGSGQMRMAQVCADGIEALRSDKNLFLLGSLQALTEANVYLLIFAWTPLLQTPTSPETPALGIVFSSMMLGFACGWFGNKLAEGSGRVSPFVSLALSSHLLSFCLLALTVILSFKLSSDYLLLFLVLSQVAVGFYFPSMEQARVSVLQASNPPPSPMAISGALAIFRFPLALLAVFGLMFSVRSATTHHSGNWMLLATSFTFSLPAVLCAVLLAMRFRPSAFNTSATGTTTTSSSSSFSALKQQSYV